MVQWYKEVKRNAEVNEPPQVKLLVRLSKINIERCSTETIKMRIRNAKKLIKRLKSYSKVILGSSWKVRNYENIQN